MTAPAAVVALNRALAAARTGHPITTRVAREAAIAIASTERLASAARHAANAIAAAQGRRDAEATKFDMVDIRTELMMALELFDRMPNR